MVPCRVITGLLLLSGIAGASAAPIPYIYTTAL
jgi:hypothetical protein